MTSADTHLDYFAITSLVWWLTRNISTCTLYLRWHRMLAPFSSRDLPRLSMDLLSTETRRIMWIYPCFACQPHHLYTAMHC